MFGYFENTKKRSEIDFRKGSNDKERNPKDC